MQRDTDLIAAFLVETESLTQARAAEVVGVSQNTVSSWRRGERRSLSPKTRRALLKFLEVRAETGVGDRPEPEELEGLLVSLDYVMRTLGMIDPEPGGQRARKLDTLRLIRELAANLGKPLPEEFWDIQERVERGEL